MSPKKRSAADPLHILVVSASLMDLWSSTEHLASIGYSVTGTANVWRAQNQARSGRFALAILDLPPKEVATRILVWSLRLCAVRIKVIALVSFDLAMRRPQIDVDHFIVKPLAPAELLDAVGRLIGQPWDPPDWGGGRPMLA